MNDRKSARLAIEGGPKTRTEPWPSRRLFGEEEKQAVLALFDEAIDKGSNVLGYNGPQEEAYCREFAEFLGGGFADGVNSGTNALYVALRALDIEPFTEVVVPPISDPGGIMPVAIANCVPVPADSAPGSYNMGAEQIEARITERTRAIIVAHIGGFPTDMDPIMDLARPRRIPVIEDCAQTHGAAYRGRPAGTLGDVAVFSTMFGKHHATAGQGGVVFTKSEDLYWRARRCADRGKPFGPEQGGDGENVLASLNFNMDELHAAIGRVQLRKLPDMIEKRRKTVAAVAEACRRSLKAVRLAEDPPECQGAYICLYFLFDGDAVRADKETFVHALQAEGIPATPSYLVIPTRMAWRRSPAATESRGLPWFNPLYTGDPHEEYPLPNAEATDAGRFRMDLHEGWTQREIDDLIAALGKVEAAYGV